MLTGYGIQCLINNTCIFNPIKSHFRMNLCIKYSKSGYEFFYFPLFSSDFLPMTSSTRPSFFVNSSRFRPFAPNFAEFTGKQPQSCFFFSFVSFLFSAKVQHVGQLSPARSSLQRQWMLLSKLFCSRLSIKRLYRVFCKGLPCCTGHQIS